MMQKQLSSQHLHWLLLSLASTLAIHSIHLPLWVSLSALSLGVWRYLLDKKHWALPKIRVLILVTTLICVVFLFNYISNFGRDASVSLLIIMCALKLLETKTLRDYLLVIAVAYFLVGSLFIFDQAASTFILSLIPLILLTATLIQSSLPQTTNNGFVLKLAGKMLLQSLPLMLVLFVLFPRLPGPIWGIPKDANSGMSGLNDELTLGDVGNLILNSSVAFRVQFDGDIPSSNQLYWRGPVLWNQQDNKWLTSDNPRLLQETLTSTGKPIDYTITLEPHNRLWLLMLDMPTTIPNIATLRHDYTAVAKNPVRSRIRYQVSSHYQYTLSNTLKPEQRSMALNINRNSNQASIALAKSWAHLPPERIIQTALQRFNQQPFVYTLKPPRLSENAIDHFLFKTQKGFCEHYASSFVFLMRAAGVPARIVTGYQGGKINPNGNYLIVRQSDAHAWAEVWLENKGWVRIDPTAAVAPERIEQGIEGAIFEVDELPIFVRGNTAWLNQAYLNWDSINNNWNQWVLGYDDKKQLDFLSKLSGKDLDMMDVAIAMVVGVLSLLLITAALILKRKKQTQTPVQQYYASYLKQLSKQGFKPALGEGALDFAYRISKALPKQAVQAVTIAQLYNELNFSSHHNSANKLALFKQAIHIFGDKQP